MTPYPLHLQKWPIEEVANMWEISRLHPNPLTWGHKCKTYVHGHLLGYFCGVLTQNCHFAVILQAKKSSHGRVREDIFHKTYLFYVLILYCKTSEKYTNWDQKKVFIVSLFIFYFCSFLWFFQVSSSVKHCRMHCRPSFYCTPGSAGGSYDFSSVRPFVFL